MAVAITVCVRACLTSHPKDSAFLTVLRLRHYTGALRPTQTAG